MMIANVSHSIVSEMFVSKILNQRYVFEKEIECEFLLQGLNDTYLLRDGERKYIFRIYRFNRRSKGDMQSESKFISHLEKCGAPVAGIILDKYGETIQKFECPEGVRYGVLMHCAANSELETHCILTGDSTNYGKSIGKLHRAALTFQPDLSCAKIDVEHLIWEPLLRIERAFPEKTSEIRFLNQVALKLASDISDMDAQGLTKVFIHGDLTGGNSCVSGKGEFIFFDFDCCGYGWLAYDLGVFLWSCMSCKKEVSLWDGFLEGYRSEMDLSENDLSAVYLFAAARNFWIMGYSIGQIGIKGKLSYKDRDLMQDIQFFRDRLV